MPAKNVSEHIREQYAGVARSGLSNESSAVRSVSTAFGYSAAELASLPAQANMGLSCGNPLALAAVVSGEVVLDLGCGGGMDVFLAAQKVGPTGKVIGIDMTTEMLDRARQSAEHLGLVNVEFYQATIDRLPIADNSVDCIISNCVINLVPNKSAVFGEILRVLKPGGRVAISDIALKQDLPVSIQESLEAYVGCIAGAIHIDEYRLLMREAGFEAVIVSDTGADLNVYANAAGGGCCGSDSQSASQPTLHAGLAAVMKSFDANAYAASVRVHALKPAARLVSLSKIATHPQEPSMRTIQVYDKPMCCSTGICGPQVDPVLPRFAADLDWLKSQGHRVERYNLSQQPQAFIENKTVHHLLSTEGTDCLPLILVDGNVVSLKDYPPRATMTAWVNGDAAKAMLPVATSGGCCGSTGCC